MMMKAMGHKALNNISALIMAMRASRKSAIAAEIPSDPSIRYSIDA